MNILHSLQQFLHPKSRYQSEPEIILVSKRPDSNVASILRELDEVFGLSLTDIGNIISSGTTIPREEIIGGMMEWAKGLNSEFAKSKYFPRLQFLKSIAPFVSGHPALERDLYLALTRPLPPSIDRNERSVASYIQSDKPDDFKTLSIIRRKLLS